MYNAHLHLDRSGTLSGQWLETVQDDRPVAESHLSLPSKHSLFSRIHEGSDFSRDNISRRVNYFLDAMVDAGTTRADTLVDVTADRVGLSTMELMLEIKEERKHEIDLHLGSYTPMGFIDAEPVRWQLMETGGEMADFLGSLPERDDWRLYPEHIGFKEHCKRLLTLGQRLSKPIQIHLDQHNDPRENETEVFLEIVQKIGMPESRDGVPMVWIVHLISPSNYDQRRFESLIDELAALNIGVICCPSAALSMRQLRHLDSPTGNSIARVLDMIARGLQVRLGSDNIADICSPAGTPDLLDELFVLCNALRFYDIDILAKLAAGLRISDEERRAVASHLEYDLAEVAAYLSTPAAQRTAAGE